jgi:putative heme transporter
VSKRGRNLLFGALGLAVVVVTFAVVLPRIANYGDVWDVVQTIDTTWLLVLGGTVVLNIVTYAPPWMIALPGLRFRQALPFTQASTAFTYIAPGGGLVGMAGSYGLLRAWGFESGEVTRAVAITGIWNQLSNLLLPVVAVALLSIEGGRDAVLTTAAIVGAVVFTVAVGILALVLWTDGLAESLGALAERAVNRLLRIVRRGPVGGWPAALVRFRHDTVDLIRRRWVLLTLAAVAGNLAVFLVLLVSLRAVGVSASEVTWIEAFAGWSLARALQLVPLTPGGVGPVELGLTGILVGLGGPNAEVVAAVLVYRAFTVLPTLLLGLATIAAWRWLRPERTEEGVPAPAGKRPAGEGSEPQGGDVEGAPR